MISPRFCHAMARYNRWQNNSLLAAAEGLDDHARWLDRGAFFGSIQGTLNHLLWGDLIWMSRFDGWEKPPGGISTSIRLHEGWPGYADARRGADDRIVAWAQGLTEADLGGDLVWFSGALKRDVHKPKWLCVQHFFNHQTHHRGQVHAMLTAAGATPSDTDLFIMPEGA
ncbi:MAG: DinB family protein [Rhodobacter sp.]|nr:DinB family protein [Rhodobacter sp.]